MFNGSPLVPSRLGASFLHGSIAGVYAIVTPAANVRGVVLRIATIEANTAAAWALYADTAAPSAWNDFTKGAISRGNQTSAFGVTIAAQEIYVPPGVGLWFATQAALPCVARWDLQ